MLRYRLLRWLAPRTSGQLQAWCYCAAWAMLEHYVLCAQQAVAAADEEFDYICDVVAEEAAGLVKECTPCSSSR
jgi:hypothetical protein